MAAAAAKAEEEAARAAAAAKAEEEAEREAVTDHTDMVEDTTYQETPRYFWVLYDYDPQEASPNDDDLDDELRLVQNHAILVYGDKDEDGFYAGELLEGPEAGRRGVVPSNYVEAMLEDQVKEWKAHREDAVVLKEAGLENTEESRRQFVVLYAYDPMTSSPNEDPNDELELKEGEIITVIGEVLDDGFYLAENAQGERGHVPSNFVEPADEDVDFEDEGNGNHDEDGEVMDLPQFAVGTFIRALYDYHPEDLSPNDETEEELRFAQGDKMKILGEMDEDGFYHAEHIATGNQGLVPGNFIALYSDGDDAVQIGSGYQSLDSKIGVLNH